MYFFYPIQQCVEQIYHTALPLSPTSSCLQNSYLQNITDDQPSHVTAFMGAPSTWGLLLRTIDTRPRELTCITTSGQEIIAGCGDIVNIYNAVTGVLQQSLSASEPVTKIQASLDGTTLFFAHSSSATMWDVQTGGLIHTFTTKSKVNDIAISTPGDYIACGLSNGSIRFWNIRTKQEGKSLGGGESVVAVCWLPPQRLVVAAQHSLSIYSIATGGALDTIFILDHVWGMVYCEDKDEFLVGTSNSEGSKMCSFRVISGQHPKPPKKRLPKAKRQAVYQEISQEKQSPTHPGQLMHPTLVGKEVLCITLPMGVQILNTSSYDWTNNPPLLDMATSTTVLLSRNLVVQTRDSIQIFSIDVLMGGGAHNDRHVSHIYSLDGNYIICILQPTRHIAVLKLETLREIRFDEISSLWPAVEDVCEMEPDNRMLLYSDRMLISNIMEAWWLDTSLDKQVRLDLEGVPWTLHRFSPTRSKIVIIFTSTDSSWEIRLYNVGYRCVVARQFLKSEGGTIYDLTFDSETRFYVKMYKPGWHAQIPCDITPSPRLRQKGGYLTNYTITEGEPMTLSEPLAPPSYTLDANCEWVLDAQSRKICWISPGNLRKGNGGHFWADQSLVMVGDDGVVRKVSFREPDC